MHNAAFAALGLDWRYAPLPVRPQLPDAVGCAVRGLAALGMAGANVTVPHKQAVMPVVHRLLPAARRLSARATRGRAAGRQPQRRHTYVAGFVADLAEHGVEVAVRARRARADWRVQWGGWAGDGRGGAH